MANYATHIAVGTVVSGALATLTVGADVIGPEDIMAVTLAGVAGSVLPDIDLRDSRASTILFSGIAGPPPPGHESRVPQRPVSF